jgi:hypothetical protein
MGNAVTGILPTPGTTTGAAPAVIGGVPAGIATAPGVVGPGGAASATTQALGSDAFELHGIYFKPSSYATPADCLTAAYAKGLPLDVCR